MSLSFMRLVLGDLGTNCYIIGDPDSKEAFVIDPDDGPAVVDTLKERGLTCIGILLTHGHSDHIHGVQTLMDTYGAPVYIHERDLPCLYDPQVNLSVLHGRPVTITGGTIKTVKDGQHIGSGKMDFQVLETPGHTVGGVCYYMSPAVFVGDTLFRESVGRTDFPGGDFEALAQSIRTKLFTLPDQTMAYPGHGPETQIAFEKENNPYLSLIHI